MNAETMLRQQGARNAAAFRRAFSARLSVRATAVAEAKPSTKSARKPTFPFVKIAGQEEMKLALCLNVVDPNIGGCLIMVNSIAARCCCVHERRMASPETRLLHAAHAARPRHRQVRGGR